MYPSVQEHTPVFKTRLFMQEIHVFGVATAQLEHPGPHLLMHYRLFELAINVRPETLLHNAEGTHYVEFEALSSNIYPG